MKTIHVVYRSAKCINVTDEEYETIANGLKKPFSDEIDAAWAILDHYTNRTLPIYTEEVAVEADEETLWTSD